MHMKVNPLHSTSDARSVYVRPWLVRTCDPETWSDGVGGCLTGQPYSRVPSAFNLPTPVASHCQIRSEERRINAAEVIFCDIGLEDFRSDKEDIAELAQKLKALSKKGKVKGGDDILI